MSNHQPKHFVKVREFPVGSTLYCAEQYPFYIYYFSAKEGKITDEVYDIPMETMKIVSKKNYLGQQGILHYYADGDVCVLPRTDRNFNIIPYEIKFSDGGVARSQHIRLGDTNIFDMYVSFHRPNEASVEYSGLTYCQKRFKVIDGKRVVSSTSNYHATLSDLYYDESIKGFRAQISQTVSSTPKSWFDGTSRPFGCTVRNLGVITSRGHVSKMLGQCINKIKVGVPSPPDTYLNDLYDQVGAPQVNTLATLHDLKEWKRQLPPVKDLLKWKKPKSWADMYLWYKYCFSTTKMDINEFRRWFSQLKTVSESSTYDRFSRRYYGEDGEICNYTLYCEPQIIGVLRAMGIDLSMTNVWDMIPFSFVVDWFLSIGDALDDIDKYQYVMDVKVKSFVSSCKRTSIYNPSSFDTALSGNIRLSSYTRYVDNQLPTTIRPFHLSNPLDHLLDGLSLIVSARKAGR